MMKTVTNSAELQQSLGRVLSVIERKTARPMLSYALVDVSGKAISITATNMEVSAKVVIDAVVEHEGSFCINAKNLYDVLRELPDDDKMEMELDGNSLRIGSSGNILYSFLTHRDDNFPRLSFHHKNKSFFIEADKLQDIISKVSHAISSDDGSVHLNGMFLSEVEGKLRSVSTDRHRFAMIDTKLNGSNISESLEEGIIVPRKGVFELKKMAENHIGVSIEISADEAFLYACVGERYFLSIRLIARSYPDFSKVIPENQPFKLTVKRDNFLEPVRRIKIMSNEKTNGVKIELGPNTMELSANHPSLGNAYEKIPVEYRGDSMEIGLNAQYLIDLLSTFEDDDVVEIVFGNDKVPVLMRSSSCCDYLGIIMPLEL